MTSKSTKSINNIVSLHSDLSRFAKAVNYYLSYIELVSVPDSDKVKNARPHFITESAVRFPLAEYLERRLNVSDLELEYNYPKMKPKRCDFKFTISAGESPKVKCLVELKYVKSNINLQEYFDDIMRLHFARNDEDDENTHTLFIVCGKKDAFIQFFKNHSVIMADKENTNKDVGSEFTTKQKKREQDIVLEDSLGVRWLSFSREDTRIMEIRSDLWEAFSEDHFYRKKPKEDKIIALRDPIPTMPETIKTSRVYIAGLEEDLEHSVGIWEIY